MRHDEIQYIADTLLIERLIQMDAAIEKRGADLGEMAKEGLSGAAQAIASFVRDNVDFSSPKATGISLLKILGPGILFRINPFIAMAFSAASSMFGIHIPSIWDSLLGPIKGKIEQGIPIDPNELKIPDLQSSGFDDIRSIVRNGELLKIAQRAPAGGFAMFPPKNVPMIYKMFGFLGPNKSKNIVTGFLMWMLKTALLSAGLMAVSGGLAKIIDPKNKPAEQAPPTGDSQIPSQQWQTPQYMGYQPKTFLQPSGKGEQFHANDANTAWIVPLSGNVRNTLLDWTMQVYPQLQNKQNDIESLPSFNRMVNVLEDNLNEKSPNYLMVPAGYNKIIDIVNSFAQDIKKDSTNALS